jgi:hypothetical protein
MELVLLFFLLCALGMVAVVFGAFARRQRPDGHVGWCRACRYPVHEVKPLCSECGQDLSGRGLRLSLPRRRPGLIILGVLMFLVGAGGISADRIAASYNFDWNTIKPVWWLELEAEGGPAGDSDRARVELLKRYQAGDLTTTQSASCSAAALDRFNTRADWISGSDAALVETAWVDGLLGDEALQAYYEANWDVYASLKVPARMRAGKPAPFKVGFQTRFTPTFAPASMKIRFGALRHDDGSVLEDAQLSNGTLFGWSIASMGASWGQQFFLDLPEGSHQLEMDIIFTILLASQERFTWTHAYPFTVTIVSPEEELVGLVENEEVREAIREAVVIDLKHLKVEIDSIHSSSNDKHVGFVGIKEIPVPVGFDVFLRHSGREDLVNGIVRIPGVNTPFRGGFLHGGLLADLLPEGTTTVDVILRANPRTAEGSFDSLDTAMAIWDGELIFRDVPVSRQPIDANE